MNGMKGLNWRRYVLLVALCTGSFNACALDTVSSEHVLRIASWNVQTLFDGTVQGTEYADYGIGSEWNDMRFVSRLESMKDAFSVLCEAGVPTVIVLQEIENEKTLNALRETCLAGRGFRWQAWAGREHAALGLGVLSRVPLIDCRTHVLINECEPDLRPVFECLIDAPGGRVRIFACHWKSKLGGAEKTESLRRGAADLINRRIRSLKATGDTVPNLVMGDFNCNPDEFERMGKRFATAILPVDQAAAGIPDSGQSLLLGEQAQEDRDDGRLVFMSPWRDSPYEGSYYYAGEWERIDQFLLGPGFFKRDRWEYRGFSVCNTPPFTRDGVPFRYSAHNGLGCSDHLPLVVDFSLSGSDRGE